MRLGGREVMGDVGLGMGGMRQGVRDGPGFGGLLGETGEEFVSHALGDAVDQAGAKLGHLPADMRFDV